MFPWLEGQPEVGRLKFQCREPLPGSGVPSTSEFVRGSVRCHPCCIEIPLYQYGFSSLPVIMYPRLDKTHNELSMRVVRWQVRVENQYASSRCLYPETDEVVSTF